MLDLPQYLLGAGALALAIGSLACGAARVRARLLAGWSGLPARLGDAILTAALLLWVAELLGLAGLLERGPLLAACLLVGLGLRFAVKAPDADQAAPPPAPAVGRAGRWVAISIAAIVTAHWLVGTSVALGAGMTGYDSAWYHMPFAAHFAQTGSTLDFAFVSPRYLSWFYPQNSELLHGVGMVLVGRDTLSPLLNLVWLAGCLAAAWCVGRPYGVAPWTLTAVAVLLDSGVMADQAGEARNDTLGLFLLLGAVAIVLNAVAARAGPRRGPLAVSGLAAGLAAGTKLSLLGPVGLLAAGVPALAAAGGRRAAALAFALPALAGCGFWYLRNAVLADNPLPWLRGLGPLRLDGPEQGLGGRHQASVLDYIGDGNVWHRWLEPGLSHRLGELWPLLLLAVALAVLACLVRGERALRWAACAAAAGVFVYLIDGTSAEGPPGSPVGFASSLRHLLPALCLGLAILPLAPGLSSRRGRAGLGALLALLLVASDLSAGRWELAYLIGGLGAAALAALVIWPPASTSRPPRRAALAAICGLLPLAVAGGWFVQRSYLQDRYEGHDFRSAGLDAAFAWASHQEGQRIATTFPVQYPLFGADLSNRVSFVGRRISDAGFTSIRRCRPLRAALAAGGYRYVVTGGMDSLRSGRGHCLATYPRADPVIRHDGIAVFRLRHRSRS